MTPAKLWRIAITAVIFIIAWIAWRTVKPMLGIP
jgi:hypothetical protein